MRDRKKSIKSQNFRLKKKKLSIQKKNEEKSEGKICRVNLGWQGCGPEARAGRRGQQSLHELNYV